MKSMIRISRNIAFALALAGLMSVPAAFAQQKGAEKLIQLKPVVSVVPADVIIPVSMSCPKCKDTTGTVAEVSFKGATHGQLKTVAVHQCAACATKIQTQGQGKAAKDVAAHTCNLSDGQAGGCGAMK